MTAGRDNSNLNLLYYSLDWNHDLLSNRSYPVRIITMAVVLGVTTAGTPLAFEPDLNLEILVNLSAQLPDSGPPPPCLSFLELELESGLLVSELPQQNFYFEWFWGFCVNQLEVDPNLGSSWALLVRLPERGGLVSQASWSAHLLVLTSS
jgi:hypothetical protein